MDARFEIPGTGIRFGLDSILGLIPGVGDWLTSIFSLYLISRALSAGAPASVIGRMVANVLFDLGIGAIPVLGDVADLFWKSNLRNVRLLESFERAPVRTVRRSRLWNTFLILGIIFVVGATLYAAIHLVAYLWNLIF